MKDKKGFTLIELIVTIALIALITVSVGVSMNGMLDKQTEKEYASYVKTIENTACSYAEIKGYTSNINIRIGDLINYGILREDLKNPKTDKYVSEYSNDTISVTWVDFTKNCKYTPSE